MASIRGTLSFVIGTWAVTPPPGHPNWDDPDPTEEVPALFVDGVDRPIWVAPFGTYWDEWGDSSGSLRETIADGLRAVLIPVGDPTNPLESCSPEELRRLAAVGEAAKAAARGECTEHGVKWPCFTCVKTLEDIRFPPATLPGEAR